MKFPVPSDDSSLFDWYDTAEAFHVLKKAIVYTYRKCCQYEGGVTDKEISEFTDSLHALASLVHCISLFRSRWRDSFDPDLLEDLDCFIDQLDLPYDL